MIYQFTSKKICCMHLFYGIHGRPISCSHINYILKKKHTSFSERREVDPIVDQISSKLDQFNLNVPVTFTKQSQKVPKSD